MNAVHIPGFTAEAAVRGVRKGDRRSRTHHAHLHGPLEVVPQLRTGVGGLGGGRSLHWPSWCEVECEAVAAACFAAAVATNNPGVGIACAKAEVDCLNDCNAWSSGGFFAA